MTKPDTWANLVAVFSRLTAEQQGCLLTMARIFAKNNNRKENGDHQKGRPIIQVKSEEEQV